MAANLIGRYIWEISELNRSRHGLTLEELNERWERSSLYDGREIIRKTWYSHRMQIASQFGVFIECNKRTNRYYIAYQDTIGSGHQKPGERQGSLLQRLQKEPTLPTPRFQTSDPCIGRE